MKQLKRNLFFCFMVSCLSFPVFSANSIKVSIQTQDLDAAAVGFSFDNSHYGGLGKSYSHSGIAGKVYSFGYRKGSIFGKDISCGDLVLHQDSQVVLMNAEGKCISVLS